MDATAFEQAARALIEQFRATQLEELLVQRERARENAGRDPAAYQAMLQVQTAIVFGGASCLIGIALVRLFFMRQNTMEGINAE